MNNKLGTPPTLMMRKAVYYRASLAAPIVIPLLAVGLGFLLQGPFIIVAVLVGGSLMYTWWSYPLFAIAVLLWSRGQSSDQLIRVSRWLPVLYAPLCGIQMAIFYGRAFTGPGATWWTDFFGGLLMAVAFGYVYLGVVLFAGRVLSDPRGTAGEPAKSFIAPEQPGT